MKIKSLVQISCLVGGMGVALFAKEILPMRTEPFAVETVYAEQTSRGPRYVAIGMDAGFERQSVEIDILTFDKLGRRVSADPQIEIRKPNPYSGFLSMFGLLVAAIATSFLAWSTPDKKSR